MACYCSPVVRYRGRVIKVGLRYCCMQGGGGAKLITGKSINFSKKDLDKLERLACRRPSVRLCPG